MKNGLNFQILINYIFKNQQNQTFYYIYFIENDIKYYMYLLVKKNKTNYDVVFRENTSRFKEPFILNNAKWRFIRTEDYIDNIFDNVKILYNIRSKIYFNKSLDKNAIQINHHHIKFVVY